MKTFEVTICTVNYETYEIEAETEETARDNLWFSMGDPIERETAECEIIETREVKARTIEGGDR